MKRCLFEPRGARGSSPTPSTPQQTLCPFGWCPHPASALQARLPPVPPPAGRARTKGCPPLPAPGAVRGRDLRGGQSQKTSAGHAHLPRHPSPPWPQDKVNLRSAQVAVNTRSQLTSPPGHHQIAALGQGVRPGRRPRPRTRQKQASKLRRGLSPCRGAAPGTP